ncbi:hypothetical protein AVEN_111300-1 [Araneus ventricosus]|uniref:Uncharacterized protein n=1 Tax=Araneus ventricosus TaxID=182803 RepID=A0A4Y2GJP0_ARAVE|nr:hypothetical protein AVEN_111300-1 [Araneus ventricosus]
MLDVDRIWGREGRSYCPQDMLGNSGGRWQIVKDRYWTACRMESIGKVPAYFLCTSGENYLGSSNAMEVKVAEILWKRIT